MAEELELVPEQELQQQDGGSIQLPESNPILDAEWCFQFFDNEPVVFAYSNEGEEAAVLNLQIKPTEGEGLTFKQNGMLFRVFPRHISEETKLERTKANKDDIR